MVICDKRKLFVIMKILAIILIIIAALALFNALMNELFEFGKNRQATHLNLTVASIFLFAGLSIFAIKHGEFPAFISGYWGTTLIIIGIAILISRRRTRMAKRFQHSKNGFRI